MRLFAYDLEALVRMSQQAPWEDGLKEVRLWSGDVRRSARPETGFGRGAGAARTFDAGEVDRILGRLVGVHIALGEGKPLQDLIGTDPTREITPGYAGWAIYEDLVRVWTSLVTAPMSEAALLAKDGPGSLLGPLGAAIGRDLTLARDGAICRGIGMPYPASWRDLPRARIYNVGVELLDLLCEIGSAEVASAAAATGRSRDEIAAAVGTLIRHCELARQMDLVVGIDPDDAFFG